MSVLDSLNRARVLEAASQMIVEDEVDDEVAYGEVVAEQGGIDEEEEEEEVVEEAEEEEEEIELAEFIWPSPPNPKSKTYYKDQYNKVYRIIDDSPEDEPFAEYDEVNNKLVKIA